MTTLTTEALIAACERAYQKHIDEPGPLRLLAAELRRGEPESEADNRAHVEAMLACALHPQAPATPQPGAIEEVRLWTVAQLKAAPGHHLAKQVAALHAAYVARGEQAEAERCRAEVLDGCAKAAEARVAIAETAQREAVLQLAAAQARVKELEQSVIDATAMLAERERQAEAALPECVRQLRARPSRYWEALLRRVESIEGFAVAEALQWLASAPASAVSRLALSGDALRAVQEWRASSGRDAPMAVAKMLRVLIGATVLDADALLRAVNDAGLPPGWRRLFDALPAEWRALVEKKP